MKILFITIGRMEQINQHALYTDLLRCFRDKGHEIYTVSAYEKRLGKDTELSENGSVHMLHVRVGNLTKTSLIEKAFSTLAIEFQYLWAIKKYYNRIHFDLIVYTTPPITLVRPIRYIKNKCNARTYLLLKDIFPQNAVDLGMMRTSGLKGILYKFFRSKEKKLYAISDRIGCMSQANVDYILKHNPEIDPSIVEICPNSIEVLDMRISDEEKLQMRKKYGIPTDKKVFVYGGNLGKPQGIPFLIDCLRAQKDNDKAFFLIVGDGTEYGKLESFVNEENPTNMKLMQRLPKDDYDKMVAACDVGMIFLDHRFTIPNFPSRLLSYLQAGIPVLACTDPNTDIGKVITAGNIGWWCESNNVSDFSQVVLSIVDDCKDYSSICMDFIKTKYSADIAAKIIIKS